jgi:hypothetical protein
VLTAVSKIEPRRQPDAEPLGGKCQTDLGCQIGLQCEHLSGVMNGQCAATCNAASSCQERFGSSSMCLGADLCARTCDTNADCPSGSLCNDYRWCEAQR